MEWIISLIVLWLNKVIIKINVVFNVGMLEDCMNCT